MKAKLITIAIAVLASNAVWAAESQKAEPPKPGLVYELTIDGQTYEVSDSAQTELTLDGKTVRVTVRTKPIQHYATNVLEFDYDKSLSLRDDQDKVERTVNLVHGSSASIVVMQLGETSADGLKPALAARAQHMESRFKRGVAKDLQKSAESPVEFKGAKGYTLTITYKDEDDDQQTCKIYALESKNQRFAVIVQCGSEEKAVAEGLGKITLESITAK
jgi:hypothetical protein